MKRYTVAFTTRCPYCPLSYDYVGALDAYFTRGTQAPVATTREPIVNGELTRHKCACGATFAVDVHEFDYGNVTFVPDETPVV